jgi:hypothetical protein
MIVDVHVTTTLSISLFTFRARFNKSAIVDESIAAQELSKLLALPIAQRRAVHLR